MKPRTSWIGLIVACSIAVCSGAAAAAQPAAPPAGYKIDEKYTKKSPDGATTIEQYLNKDTDDWKWQFWVRRQGALAAKAAKSADYAFGSIRPTAVKPLRRECRIASAALYARVRTFLRPLIFRGRRLIANLGQIAPREGLGTFLSVKAEMKFFRRPGLDPGPIRRGLSVRTPALDTFRKIKATAYGSRVKPGTTQEGRSEPTRPGAVIYRPHASIHSIFQGEVFTPIGHFPL